MILSNKVQGVALTGINIAIVVVDGVDEAVTKMYLRVSQVKKIAVVAEEALVTVEGITRDVTAGRNRWVHRQVKFRGNSWMLLLQENQPGVHNP